MEPDAAGTGASTARWAGDRDRRSAALVDAVDVLLAQRADALAVAAETSRLVAPALLDRAPHAGEIPCSRHQVQTGGSP